MPRKNMFEDIKPISRSGHSPSPLRIQHSEEDFSTEEEVLAPLASKRSKKAPTHHSLPREVPYLPEPPKASSMHALWYIAALAVVVFFFSFSFLFEHATIKIIPKSVPVALDSMDIFTAQKDTTNPDAILYTEMTLSGDQSITLPSTDTKVMSNPARGVAVLYNSYSATPYKLAKNTRLQSPDGRIYRLDVAVTIPGYKKSGADISPGFMEAAVTAAVTGEAGNLEAADFTLPGLAGTPQATKIYARSKSPFTGGLSGTLYTIPQESANAAAGALATKLKESLLAKAKVQVPDGYLFYDSATLFMSDGAVVAPYSKEAQIPVALHGTLTAYLIKKDTLVQAIAKKFVSQYGGESIQVPSLPSLVLTPSAVLNPANDTSFTFTFTGSGSVVWMVDPATVVAELTGKKKADYEAILAKITGVDKAEVVIKPFWKQSFPKDASRISVTIDTP